MPRNHYQQQQQRRRPLLRRSVSFICFITLTALLLPNDLLPLALADGGSCDSAPSIPLCPQFHKFTSFPFVTSPACESASSFAITGCDSAGLKLPIWNSFVNAINSGISPPFVYDFFTILTNKTQFPVYTNTSIDVSRQNVGLINLTWNSSLTSRDVCNSLVPLPDLFKYMPQSINLAQFAHSAFEFSNSNIILLFGCNTSSSVLKNMLKDSPACRSYAKSCNLSEKASSRCYQYMPTRQELNLSEAIHSSNCSEAMFFVSSEMFNFTALRWSPDLIQLNWSAIRSHWMNETLNSCSACLKSNGSCGYNESDNFLCLCADNKVSSTSCVTVQAIANAPTQYYARGGTGRLQVIGMKIALVAVGFAVALSLALALFCIWKRKMKTSASSSPYNKSWLKKPSFLWRRHDPILAKEISYEEIVLATESFAENHMLGDGGFGAVYKGVLADGRKVAVKRLYHDNYRRMEHFINEIKVLSNLNHPNLIKLYGFSYEDQKELLLIFEYASQGTVSDHLHDASRPPMPWKLRLDIACETAEALSYLHNSVSPPIYHRDVKTTNILLDEEFHAKLADFGLSKLVPLRATHVSTAPQGTPGYLDPEYHQCYQLTDKSDVYSLGVVLMELVSAKLAVDMSRGRGEINLSTLAVMKIQCGKSEELVDPRLEVKKNPHVERSINRVLEVAFQCLHADRDGRPSMSSLGGILAKIRGDYADEDAEVRVDAHCTPTICQSCVPNGLNRPFDPPVDSPGSVVSSDRSSNPPSSLSSS